MHVMKTRYSELLNNVLNLMLRMTPSSRISATKLEEHLSPFHEKILSLVELTEEEK